MTKISILGCGWLGLPLAQSLIDHGFTVSGSTTTESKLIELSNRGISPFLITLSERGIAGDVATFLQGSSLLIVDIPPKLRSSTRENFVAKIEQLIRAAETSKISKIIFISSTSVYADDNSIVTEETVANPETESGRQLLASEHLLQSSKSFETTIVRFGGLIGPNRHPIKSLAGKSEIANPDSPINLIHQIDCIGIIKTIIIRNVGNEVFNGVAAYHPTRKEYYTSEAIKYDLPAPTFSNNESVGKKVVSVKVTSVLHYNFQYPEL